MSATIPGKKTNLATDYHFFDIPQPVSLPENLHKLHTITIQFICHGLPERNAGLDKILRQCAWKAVVNHPYTGLTDKNANRIADQIENQPDKK